MQMNELKSLIFADVVELAALVLSAAGGRRSEKRKVQRSEFLAKREKIPGNRKPSHGGVSADNADE